MGESDERLWAEGLKLLRTLADAGHEAYMVGGSVRDRLIGRPLHDIDIATSALPEAVQALFPRTLPTGLQHGTVTVIVDGDPFEVTTYRTESGYSDSRRPDEVAFVTDVREDLSRRDFTFNAMAVGLDGALLDPFGGREDLSAGIVRTVGRAADRFGEDALRMLRAIRFGAEFGFELASDTWEGIATHKQRLSHVAMERVGAEWDKMIAGQGPDQACAWLQHSGLLVHLKERLPSLTAARIDGWGLANARAIRLAAIDGIDVRWAAYWIGVGASEADALSACKTLRMSGKRSARIAAAVGFERRLADGRTGGPALLEGCDQRNWIEAVLDYGVPAAEDWLAIEVSVRGFEGLAERDWLAAMPITRVGQLAVRGDELSKLLGRSPGPWVARLLRALLSEVAHGKLPNEKADLTLAARNWITRMLPPEMGK
ncbi:CCA tRNA nucleotidyltransferase [Cohnella yongneupensis]|uniref:CCA tRNA nucleotidyltransferase n=1 Tax=Cohnella yongneupensis TaxID=425006 RepID=A0ABW0R5J4_9BACL